jgi:hypothetical protein
MRVVIVEDDRRKAERLFSAVSDIIDQAEIREARSYQSGLPLVLDFKPELLILDMSIPNFDVEPGVRSGKPRPLGGYDLLRKLRRRGFAVKTVVVTQLDHFGDGGNELTFKELSAKCSVEFHESFIGCVYYGQASSAWVCDLHRMLKSAGIGKA